MRLLLIIMLLPMFSIGQFDTTKFYRSPNVGEIFRRAKINALMLPSDTNTNKVGIAQLGGVLYAFGSGKWNAIVQFDTTTLSNRINTKLNISDTSAMLNVYKHWLVNYLRSSDTSSLLASKAFTNATYALRNRSIVASYGLAGGGDLSADRSFIVDTSVIAAKTWVNANDIRASVQPAFSFFHRGTGAGFPSFRQRLFFNKDSIPITTVRRWGFVLDSTTGEMQRQQLLNYSSGVVGRVPFFTDVTTLGNDTAFRWDNTNKRLGINITPIDKVHIGGNKFNSILSPEFTGLVISDLSSAVTGVGGGIVFRGNHSGTTFSTTAGVIQTYKENSTAGDISFAMTFHTRLNGTSQWPERVRITS
ncbi:MAG: hypothetical protein ACOVO1_03600, partial [Chitinophagaceae bacterium]